ncbi:hypothetical protein TVAG_011800 [Trichomonas vaginalis G3]|uniref:Uncharacterized protein n=1 Tax=Trichomonas vaginalis (strain ATCC PRA-98 / G3) TaxID=412133 RepID=A2FNJ8_TRIV3|nr:hypothetical protein TVAGG3_0747690 [Trichomonas vaginalis G3]EAX93536.1 hypothetical protein TVAG_011800 [Trichomonas vaginalis G3]KAI5512288.1 hypothetical protein TVAGG3_0747690 [Trichomonas vaginalis G3]|eukprot:XP_001306466.1 hypothetical protein [Trichomonas vaginalis G3]
MIGSINVNKAYWAFQRSSGWSDDDEDQSENSEDKNQNQEEEDKNQNPIQETPPIVDEVINPCTDNNDSETKSKDQSDNQQEQNMGGLFDNEFKPQLPRTARGPRARLYSRKLQRVNTARVPDYEALDEKIKESFDEIDRMLLQIQNGETVLEQKQATKMKNLIKKQRSELLDHDQDWRHGAHYKMFYRDSQFLRNLKNQQAMLQKMNRFDDASLIKKQINEVSSQEFETNKKNHAFAFYKSRTELMERQKKERENAMQNAAEKKNAYIAQREKKTEILNLRYAILKDVGIRNSRARLPRI